MVAVAVVASGLAADLLVILTDVDGVHTGPPGSPGAERIGVWDDARVVAMGDGNAQGRGGMLAKLGSARAGAAAAALSGDRG